MKKLIFPVLLAVLAFFVMPHYYPQVHAGVMAAAAFILALVRLRGCWLRRRSPTQRRWSDRRFQGGTA